MTGLSTSHVLTESAIITGGSGDTFGYQYACSGDRDGDGYQDLAVSDSEAGYGDSSAVLLIDGPFTEPTTDESAAALLSVEDWNYVSQVAWVDGVSDDGNDGLLFGSSQEGYPEELYYPTAYYEPDPEGSYASSSIHARINSEGDEGFYIGQVVRSADVDLDGVADLLVSVYDSEGTGTSCESMIAVYDADTSGEVVYTEEVSGIYSVTSRCVDPSSFFDVGDIDQDGHPDILYAVRFGGTESGHWDYAVSYGNAYGLGDHDADEADAYVDLSADPRSYGLYGDVLGDFNADGEAGDVVVGGKGSLYFSWDPPSGTLEDDDLQTVEISSMNISNPTSLGDINADGYDDLAVGDPYDNEGGDLAGAIWLLYGGTDW